MEIFKDFLTWDIAAETWASLIVILIIFVLYLIIGILAKHHDPLKPSKGLLWLGETLVEFFDRLAEDLMGPRFRGFGGIIMGIASYLFVSFIFGLTGLPSPVTYLATPLSLAFITFFMIHGTSVRYTKWRYFKRYIEPVPLFLPMNLISMWAPVLALSLRLFGNAIAGWVIMTLLYNALDGAFQGISIALFDGTVFSPLTSVCTPILHAYFDLFSGFIQTTVFIFLTMIYVSQEAPEEEIETNSIRRGGE